MAQLENLFELTNCCSQSQWSLIAKRDAAKCFSLLWGAVSIKRLGTNALDISAAFDPIGFYIFSCIVLYFSHVLINN